MPTPDPIPALKVEVAQFVVHRVRAWSQHYAAAILDIDQPRVSHLQHGRLERFSLEKLIRLVARAGGDVQITVKWTRKSWLS